MPKKRGQSSRDDWNKDGKVNIIDALVRDDLLGEEKESKHDDFFDDDDTDLDSDLDSDLDFDGGDD